VAESVLMQGVLDLVRRAARGRATVLVTGESGTGKELVARALHYHSERVAGPFVAANCRAFASGVLESELFGHERGAFTGAERTRPGLFERAQGGTVFLDEIGDVSLDFQAKLLRVLQERRAVRVGGSEERALDFRLVAASQRDLRREVAAGRFREDLYFRLAVIPIQLPPLRERRDEVLPLARHFFARANAGRQPPLAGWSEEVEAHLLRHPWPGNARELENAIERALVLSESDELCVEDLRTRDARGEPEVDPAARLIESAAESALSLQELGERYTDEILRRCDGNKVHAAAILKIDRKTLYRRAERRAREASDADPTSPRESPGE
jgi:DNA-binding NtrC family response regulator